VSQLSLPSSTHVINDPATNIFFGAFSPDLRKSHGTVASGPAGGGTPGLPSQLRSCIPLPLLAQRNCSGLPGQQSRHQDVRGWSVDDDDDDDDDVDDDGESGTAAGRSGFSRCDRRSPSISVPPVDLLRQSSPSSTRCKPDHESVNGLVVDI